MIEARSLWELIERRAALTPDALFGVDEEERRLSFAEYQAAAERAAAANHEDMPATNTAAAN